MSLLPLTQSAGPIRFGTDGWRGVLGVDVTAATVLQVAVAAAQELAATAPENLDSQEVLIGFDRRFLAPELAELAAAAVQDCHLLPLLTTGPTPTPTMSWAVRQRQALGALILTASHNPPEWLGLKIKGPFGGSVESTFTARVERRLRAGSVMSPGPGPTSISRFDAWTPYLAALSRLVDCRMLRQRLQRLGWQVLVDPMHGAAAGGLPQLLGDAVVEIRSGRDPLFGGHAPEPLAPNLQELIHKMQVATATGQTVVGLAFDGDGDRLAAVDETGVFCSTQLLIPLLIDHLGRDPTQPGVVVKTVSGSDLMVTVAKNHGRRVVETAVGFKHIAAVMRQEAVLLGGEESGGVGFGHHMPERDGLLAALLVLEALVTTEQPLGQHLTALQQRSGLQLHYDRLDLHLGDPATRNRLLKALEQQPPQTIAGEPVTDINHQDGIKLRLGKGLGHWLMLRFSGTEPLLRLYCEAPTPEQVRTTLAWAEAFVQGA
ncbi:phosphoglucosamine mutase [Candidatus Synechococcus spongiarum LMB bulk15M]|uniref:Phosphoglucosamine mutase n=1 Tax=Candidatus Synechococcus spongiarum LMB bulk15M TaxID=1943582 RepID=A0A1T1D306_9SYNE|nr:phosphoglucosamine mutase [Candidatus Synechococcus spongiarum LMB bulk15M]